MDDTSDEDFDAAERHFARREFSEAAKLSRRVVEAGPKNSEAWRLLGDSLREMRNYDKALAAYEQALALRPHDAEVYYGRGAAYSGSQQWREAIRDFSQAMKLNPHYAEAALEIGQAWGHRWRRHRRAANCLRFAVRLKADWDDPRFFLGLDYYHANRWHDRLRVFRKAVEAAPDWAEGYYIIGVIQANEGGYQANAAEAFQSAVRLRPDWVKAWLALGQAHSDLEEWEPAVHAYKQAVALDAANAEAYLGLGTAYHNTAQWPEALAAYRAAQERSPNLPEIAYHLGEVYSELLLPTEAATWFRRSLELRPGLAEAHYGLGASCFRLGDNDGAKEQIDILLQLDQELAQELYSRCFITEDA